MILKFLNNYNNYQNRIIKTTKTYGDIEGYENSTFNNINFDMGNGILTTQIVNWTQSWLPDYMLLLNSDNTEHTSETTLDLDSTWFVLDIYKIRKGQYKVTLKRDVIENFKNNILEAPMFVEKATLAYNNPLIFNKEGMTYNQIKKSETLLYDKSNTPWIVGYINKKGNIDEYTFTISSSSGSQTLSGITNITSAKQYALDTAGNTYTNEIPFKGPNDTYGWTFDSATHVFTWNTPWSLMNKTNTITVQYESDYTTSAEFEYLAEPTGYIDAKDLPWEFSPYDTMLGNVNNSASYQLELEGINSICRGRVTRGIISFTKDPYNSNKYKVYTSSATESAYDSNLTDNMFPLYRPSQGIGVDPALYLKYYMKDIVDYGHFTWTQADIDNIVRSINLKPYSSDPTSYNNRVVKYQGNFYRLTVGSLRSTTQSFRQSSGVNYDKYQQYLQVLTSYWNDHMGSDDEMYYHIATGYVPGTTTPVLGNDFNGSIAVNKYPLTITRISNTEIRALALEFPASKIKTLDAPYDIFCMPLKQVHLVNANVDTNPDATLQMAWQLPIRFGSNLYDLQILPYCPIQSVIKANGDITEVGTEGIEFSYLYDKDPNGYKIYNVCFFCRNSKGTFDLDVNLSVDNYTDNAAYNVKIESETKKYRLVSPNYSGQFEFNVAMNVEPITKINVDYEYKPYTPYIHVCPVWSSEGLFGNDYNDARGLICGGDFSLPVINDAWTQYQINNKNYDAVFNRQIENMRTNYGIQTSAIENKWGLQLFSKSASAVMGVGSSAASSGAGGAALSGVRAGIDIGTSIGAHEIDMDTRQKLYTEQEAYATDNYNMQLGNIQALPYSLSKVSAFNPNNKLVPILELYDCTNVEKDALVEKLKYEGMNVQTIAKINDFVSNENNFIRGRLIRLQQSDLDWMLLQEIITELQRGVYL